MPGFPPGARCSSRRLATLVLACCAVATEPEARQQAPTTSQPSANASVSLVLVDMRVARGDEPIADLDPAEMTLLVDDAPRPIVSLIYSPVVVASNGRADPSRRDVVAGATRTGTPPARRVVLVVDRESLNASETGQLQTRAERFVAQLPGNVRIAVATLPLGSTLRFESDRSALLAALRTAFEGSARQGAGLEGIAGFGCIDEAASAGCGTQGIHPAIRAPEARAMNTPAEWLVRGKRTLTDLQWLFRTLAGGPPSDIVIMSGALPYQSALRVEIDRTLAMARTADVRVHAVELANIGRVSLPEGGPESPPPLSLDSLHELNDAAYGLPVETGGVQALGTVSGAAFFEQLAHELSSTYLLSFEPTDTDRDGRPHRIEIRSSRRPPLTIQARKTFIAYPSSPATPRTHSAPGEAPPPEAPLTTTSLTSRRPLSRTDAWVALARSHQAGARDRELIDVAQWNSGDLRNALNGLTALGRRVPTDTLNDALLRGALLHADVALLAPDLALQFQGFPEWGALHTVEATDGQAFGVSVVSAHWHLARALLDRVQPRPDEDPRVLRWYRGVGGTLLANRQFAAALPHLDDARRLFPRDRDINALCGLLHEALADAASQELPGDAKAAVGTSHSELRASRQYLSRAVETDPHDDEAQLHLGRVCHLLGDDEAAVAAVSSVMSRTRDARKRYIGELLTGAIHQATGRLDSARESFERAAGLYPMAQAPLVALSYIAREAGDRSESARYIEQLAALPPPAALERDDPWWHYQSAAVADHASVLETLRAELRDRSTQ